MSSDERRRHQRVPARIPCLLRDDAGTESPFDVVDLSESGVRLRCGQPISAMTRIRVSMQLPPERIGRDDPAEVDTVGVVVWSHEVSGGQYDTGVFFSELDEDDRALLQAYVLSAV